MRSTAVGRGLVGAVFLAVLVACSSDPQSSAEPSATVPTAPATTTTTDPYAVPAVIDAAYVNRVLAGLDAGVGEVVRMVVRTKTIPREATDRLRALYGSDVVFDRVLDSLSRDVSAGLSAYRPDPGNRSTTVVELLSAKPACIFAKVSRDYSAVSNAPLPSLGTQWVGLRTLDRARDPFGYNTVSWSYIYDGAERNFGPPATDPCSGF